MYLVLILYGKAQWNIFMETRLVCRVCSINFNDDNDNDDDDYDDFNYYFTTTYSLNQVKRLTPQ